MISMIIKMSLVTALNILLSLFLWKRVKNKKLGAVGRIVLGIIFGVCAILSTHFGIDYNHMMLNVRDLAPLTAGLFIDPVVGIIAGFIGGIERYIVGTYFGVGSYTRVACSISTCLSGVLAAVVHQYIFKKKKPSFQFAYFMGSTMEVFHMYVVFVTHRNDMDMAYLVVKTCAGPMIIFTGIGLGLISILIRIDSGEWKKPVRNQKDKEIQVSQKFQFWLFLVTFTILLFNFLFGFMLQTQSALQNSEMTLQSSANIISESYNKALDKEHGFATRIFSVGDEGGYEIVAPAGDVIYGVHKGNVIDADTLVDVVEADGTRFNAELFDEDLMCVSQQMEDGNYLVTWLTMTEVYRERDRQAYETVLSDILLFTVIYVLIAMLVQRIVVSNLELVNKSLKKITGGDLDEKVSVYTSTEFASLSDDINQTVNVLKEYISAAEKRIEKELEFAKTIQESALPHNFDVPRTDMEIYASMDAAKEVGGDFYDFFFVDSNKLCLVIADVSDKGIPASLFMMRSKAIIRNLAEAGKTPSEIFEQANNRLCDGNEAGMFVTVWLGMINLQTGHMVCSNAGHEYPVVRMNGGDYEYLKKKHNLALAVFPDVPYKEYEIDLSPGDSIFVYTDGVPEANNETEEEYGPDRLLKVMNENKDVSQETLLKNIRQDVKDFVGAAKQFDDLTMLGFHFLGQDE